MSNKYFGDMKLLSKQKDYEKFNIVKGTPEIWEDGMRTNGGPNTYEWWYVDTKFDNGMIIVVTFFSKNGADAFGPAHPKAEVVVTYPDGSVINHEVYEEKGNVVNASKEYCDVKIKDTFLKYVDGDYILCYIKDDFHLELKMKSTLPMYRPETGHATFGDEELEYMGWFVAQPKSIVLGTLSIDGKKVQLNGTGYHDHNWGTGFMLNQFNHWYWGRATIGEYTFITANMVSTKRYGNSVSNIFMLGKDGVILDNDLSKVIVERKDTYKHKFTKKFMDNHITFTQPIGDITYKIEYIREKDLEAWSFLSKTKLPKLLQKIIRKTFSNPTYVRCVGKVKLTIINNQTETILEDEGLWEQMFFGKNKVAKFGR